MRTKKTRSKKLDASIRLFSSDVDGTLLPFTEIEGQQEFTQWWSALPAAKRPILCYNSGRLCADVRVLIDKTGLITPDYIIGGVGTSLIDEQGHPVPGFHDRFREDWDRSLVQELLASYPGIQMQPACFQSPYKSSWYLHHATREQIEDIEAKLVAVELSARVIYSSDRDLDVLPALAGKGHALQWLCQHLGITGKQVIVAGDSENDLAMFKVPDVRGILVGNARAGLIQAVTGCTTYQAQQHMVNGVIEGLRHYGLGN
jgi:sucrose-6F-phosphate phosphohydrolase